MCTAKELIEFLQKLPEDAEISVVTMESAYSGDIATEEVIDLTPLYNYEGIDSLSTDNIEVLDARNNPLMKEEARRVYVTLGNSTC